MQYISLQTVKFQAEFTHVQIISKNCLGKMYVDNLDIRIVKDYKRIVLTVDDASRRKSSYGRSLGALASLWVWQFSQWPDRGYGVRDFGQLLLDGRHEHAVHLLIVRRPAHDPTHSVSERFHSLERTGKWLEMTGQARFIEQYSRTPRVVLFPVARTLSDWTMPRHTRT